MNIITRIWHGITRAEYAHEYLKYVEETGMLDYRKVKGNLSAKLLRRTEGDVCHFLTVTEWDSYESIKEFAGEDFKKAKHYPGDEEYLIRAEEEVMHFETFVYL